MNGQSQMAEIDANVPASWAMSESTLRASMILSTVNHDAIIGTHNTEESSSDSWNHSPVRGGWKYRIQLKLGDVETAVQ